MNKKIKVIELFKRINENKNIPKKIKYIDIEYTYDENMQEYYACKEGRTSYFFYNVVQHKWAWLGTEVEILEDEEEIGISKLEKEKVLEENPAEFRYDLRYYYDKEKMGDKINEIIKKVNELDKKINKED